MEKNKLVDIVRNNMTNHRYEHTLGVMEMSKVLASKFNVDEEKVCKAAMLHDITKEDKNYNILNNVRKITNDNDTINKKNLWHAKSGKLFAMKEIGITDKDILEAIEYHTTGHKEMSDIAKITFISDYIEENREYEAAKEIRSNLNNYESLNEILFDVCKKQNEYFIKNNIDQHPDFKELYESIT